MDKGSRKSTFWGEGRRKFFAGMLANLLYLVIAGFFAGDFFSKLNSLGRWAVIGVSVSLVASSILLYPPLVIGDPDND